MNSYVNEQQIRKSIEQIPNPAAENHAPYQVPITQPLLSKNLTHAYKLQQ